MHRRLRRATLLILLLSPIIACLTFWYWPIRPAAIWDPAPSTLIVEIAHQGTFREDTYTPIVLLWGD